MPELPLVSVVIPTRDRRQLLTRALDSVRAQTYSNLEIIVVDDGSTDGTAEYLATQSDVKVIALETNLGGAAARNRGIATAAGQFVAFLDSDDEWLPTKLERQVATMAGAEKVGAVYCRHFNHDDVTGVRSQAAGPLYTGVITEDLMAGRCPRTVSLFLVRRIALESIGGFDEKLAGFQDTDLWIRMSTDWHFDAVDEPLAIVHNHGDARITTDMTARRRALDGFLGKWGSEMQKRIGVHGIESYRRTQLAVAQGAVVLAHVRGGQRLQAFRELGRYVKMAGLSNPPQLVGLVIACIGGAGLHTRLKALKQRATS